MKSENNLPALPISETLPGLSDALARHATVILQAPPGAGKTTLVPLFLLPRLPACAKILMLEPRRLAARAAARRMAHIMGEKIGETVGYRTRFDSVVSKHTRIEVVTEGILARRLQREPDLPGVDLVIFDEFHERHLATDLSLALALDARAALRPDLRILLMSATLDTSALSHALGDAPVISSPGKSHPVEIEYLPRDSDLRIAETAAAGIRRAIMNREGDILAFLPGAGEIRRAMELLHDDESMDGCVILPLYGDLSRADQDRALQYDPHGKRRVILSTSIAESSLTIEGVRIVIDAGWTRTNVFDPATGMSGLETRRVARDSADQRAGRAGRLCPGVCFRLWSESTHHGLQKRSRPEILAADLAPLALQLAAWGSAAAKLTWLDPPPGAALSEAGKLLILLKAIDASGKITALGREMSEMPVHPRLSHMIMKSRELEMTGAACDIAAILEERDIIRGDAAKNPDLRVRLDLLDSFRKNQSVSEADVSACRHADRNSSVLKKMIRAAPTDSAVRSAGKLDRMEPRKAGMDVTPDPGLLLALAYPDRIALRREVLSTRLRRAEPRNAGPGGVPHIVGFLLSNGKGVALRNNDAFRNESLIVAARLDSGIGDGTIHLAAPVDEAALRAHLPHIFSATSVVGWNPDKEAITSEIEERIGAIVLNRRADQHDPVRRESASRTPACRVDDEFAIRIWIEVIRKSGLAMLPWTGDILSWRTRVQFLRAHLPEKDLPDLSDEALSSTIDSWLPPHLHGILSRRELNRIKLGEILSSLLTHAQSRIIDIEAPTHIAVPSGSNKQIEYSHAGPPVLPVKLQEMFGLAETPCIARGRVPLLLHLLSPAGRPIQVTRDLRNFWNTTYSQVRKELKGRYPKHPWPDDPWNAPATRKTKRRNS